MTDEVPPGAEALAAELRRAARQAGAPPGFEPLLERPRDPDHGDWATNTALVLAERLGLKPRELAARIRDAFDRTASGVQAVEIGGPGFLNFRLADASIWQRLPELLGENERWGRSEISRPQRVNVEFVSANPTGPLHVAHGRGAALGDAVASLLEWTGHEVVREFYVNDAGRQIDLLGESVEARHRQLRGEDAPVPEGGYHGDYVRELAGHILAHPDPELETLVPSERAAWFAERAMALLLEEQRSDLEAFGVHMDVWTRERDLFAKGRIEALLERLRKVDLAYEDAEALWFRTSDFGDEKDRVLVKGDGSLTYFTPDIAYHLEKAARGFDRAIDVWGADHHARVRSMEAALRALELPDGFFEVLILQLVTVFRGGAAVRMSKRAGDFVTLRELFEETGRDVARYFFLMRRPEVHLNFDLDLALDTSEVNPVYKVQYAHARMCSIFRKGGIDPRGVPADAEGTDQLDHPAEREVALAVLRLPQVIRTAAETRAPHQLCAYLEETAGLVNAWYHRGNLDPDLRVLAKVPALPGRIRLARAVQITLRNGLAVLGVSAPERMLREEEA